MQRTARDGARVNSLAVVLSSSFDLTLPSRTMAAPLAGTAVNVPPGTRVTRSASNLRKQLQPPSTPASASEDDDDDDAMDDDEVVLAPLPTRSLDPELSSQTRLQLARPGSSALDERVSDAPGAGLDTRGEGHGGAYSDDEGTQHGYDEDPAVRMQDEEDFEGRLGEEEDDEEGGEVSSSEPEEDSRSEGEIQAIGAEMDGVERAVPGLLGKYHLVDRLGEGEPFSCLSLARAQGPKLTLSPLSLRHLLVGVQGDRPAPRVIRQLVLAASGSQGKGLRRRQAHLRDELANAHPERARDPPRSAVGLV